MRLSLASSRLMLATRASAAGSDGGLGVFEGIFFKGWKSAWERLGRYFGERVVRWGCSGDD